MRPLSQDIEVLLETPFTDDPPPILSDPFRIKQILVRGSAQVGSLASVFD